MNHLVKLFTLSLLLLSAACATVVTEDYGKYLENNSGGKTLPKAEVAKAYYLPEQTAKHKYEFSSAMGGMGNKWIVELGPVLDATMKSKDVTEAFGPLTKASDAELAKTRSVVLDVTKYEFRDKGAHIAMNISVKDKNKEIFKKEYKASGQTQGGKMFWGGAMAMKNAVQQSTKSAIDEILVQFANDAKSIK